MALTYGFYNAVENDGEYDREYTAEQLSAIFDGLVNDGVYESVGDHFSVVPLPTPGMGVVVNTGRAWFDSTWSFLEAPETVSLDAADASLGRIDAIVLEVNKDNRINQLRVVKGTNASTPVKPTLASNQHPLAFVSVSAGLTAVTTDKIENAVGTSACPFVTGIVSVISVDSLIAQWEAMFNTRLDYLNSEIYDVENEVGADLKPVVGYNISVPASSWTTYTPSNEEETAITSIGYIYEALIPLEGVLPSMRPYVSWSIPSIISINADILNQCRSVTDGILIYAKEIPSASITALTVECRKVVT